MPQIADAIISPEKAEFFGAKCNVQKKSFILFQIKLLKFKLELKNMNKEYNDPDQLIKILRMTGWERFSFLSSTLNYLYLL